MEIRLQRGRVWQRKKWEREREKERER